MAFLFKLKKKKQNTELEVPPEPPKAMTKSEEQKGVAESSDSQSLDSKAGSGEDKRVRGLTSANKENAQETQSMITEPQTKSSVDFDLDEELKELESKLMQDIQPKETVSSPPVGFKEFLENTTKKTSKEEIKPESSQSIIVYSTRENTYFIKNSDLRQLVDEINEVIGYAGLLKNNADTIENVESKNKEITQTLLKNCNVMFNKSILCDAIIRGENNG